MDTFYLGVPSPRWLESAAAPDVPMFVSYHRLSRYRRGGDVFPKGLRRWALDSGAFSELDRHHRWSVEPDVYGGAVYRFMDDVGTPPDFVAPQDWMCEPDMVARTGLTVPIHQELTLDSVLYLRAEFPHAPWIPVLQGWRLEDYLSHVEQYAAASIDLTREPLVGLGSVCRRQSTAEIGIITSVLHSMGLRLHGFGVKCQGLARYGHHLVSADSMAWSYGARARDIRLDGCDHARCNNCLRYALHWERHTAKPRSEPQDVLTLDFANAAA